ncbi:MAG TPA: hypothetical protein VGR69_07155 [Candidatus Rubrimentiphilum sp.]|nr:hypothetical protein [Candidatus Rubrimentiphilum sp.]
MTGNAWLGAAHTSAQPPSVLGGWKGTGGIRGLQPRPPNVGYEMIVLEQHV